MAVQQEIPTNMNTNTDQNIAFDEAQALKDVLNNSVTHPIDSFMEEMTSKEWDLNTIEDTLKNDPTDIVLPPLPMTNDTPSSSRPTHKRMVTFDATSPAFVSSEDVTLTAEDWKIGVEQLLDVEPTPVSEVMKQDPIALTVQVPPSPAISPVVATPSPPPLSLPEDMPLAPPVASTMPLTMPAVLEPEPIAAAPSPVMAPIEQAPAPVMPPIEQAPAPGLEPIQVATPPVNAPVFPSTFPTTLPLPKPTNKAKRTRRKKEPQAVQYISGEPTDLDCVLGRGGKSNHHPGNKRYRAEVQNLQKWYKASGKSEKTDLSQCLVNIVHQYGGRFVKQEKSSGRWYVVSNLVARRKASQALREHMTMEERAAKKAAMLAASRP